MEILDFLKNRKVFWEYSEGAEYHPILTSGFHSDKYFNFSNLNIFSDFKLYLEETGLINKIAAHVYNIDCICGIPIGGNFFASAIGFIYDIPVISLEKTNNSFILERFNCLNKRVLIVDDVITTGKSLLATIKAFGGFIYPYIFCLVSYLKNNDIIFEGSIYNIIPGIKPNINLYPEENCELCKKGSLPLRVKNNWTLFFS